MIKQLFDIWRHPTVRPEGMRLERRAFEFCLESAKLLIILTGELAEFDCCDLVDRLVSQIRSTATAVSRTQLESRCHLRLSG